MAKQRYDTRQVASGTGHRVPSQRQRRVGEEVRHVLARVLREGESREPELANASITVTEVRMSPDLRNATAFVMPLGGAKAGEILAALKHRAGFLKGLVGRELGLRYTPNIAFALDASFDQAERIHRLLSRPEVIRDLEPATAAPEDRKDG